MDTVDMADVGTQLLLTSFSAQPASPGRHVGEALNQGLSMVQRGDHLQALALSLRALWHASTCAAKPEAAPDWFEAFQAALERQLGGEGGDGGDGCTQQLALLAAVAALYIFVRADLTGPVASALPECPFELLGDGAAEEAATAAAASAQPAGGAFGRDSISPGDRWAVSQLCEDGEEMLGRIACPQYLLLSRSILLAPAAMGPAPQSQPLDLPSGVAAAAETAGAERAGAATGAAAAGGSPAVAEAAAVVRERLPAAWAWWAQRAVLLQQRALAGRSATLRRLLVGLTAQVLRSYTPEQAQQGAAAVAAATAASPLQRMLRSAALLEAALMETAFGYVEAAGKYLQRSCEELGFSAELTGALGVRTEHQQEAKAQLVVRIERGDVARQVAALDVGLDAGTLEAALASGAQQAACEELKGFDARSDVLPQPKLLDGQEAGQPSDLGSLEQALLLALCTRLQKGSSSDTLKPWEAAAYIEAVARQKRSQFLLLCAARLQTVRFEKERPRTRERALLALEQLAGALKAPLEAVAPQERMRYAFSTWFPLSVSLRKELGELLVAAGAVGAALPLFESLELWDSLAVCYQLLGKRLQAEELVRRRLEVTPDDPRLWCTLGDLTLDDKYYLEAWERSGHRNARSQRSLARNAIRAGNWAAAAQHWETALALNPLNPEGWFSLGFAYIKEKDYAKALRACSRCVQLDPTNGEAWNNLAAIHMHAQRWPEAFAALGEATKHKRDSWQTWENYAEVAAKVGQWQVAARALREVLGLSQGARAHLGILSDIVGEVERGRGVPSARDAAEQGASAAGGESDSGGSAAGEAAAAAEGAGPLLAVGQQQPRQKAQQAGGKSQEASAGEDLGDSGMEALAQALASIGGSGSSSRGSNAGGEAAQQGQNGGRDAAALAAAEEHARGALERAVGTLLKAVANTAAGDSRFWEIYARFYAAVGQPDSARECLLKRVRGLQGKGLVQEEEGFKAFAGASLALCKSYLEAGGQRELSSARMHLRGVLKQAAERFEEHPLYRELQQLLHSVEAAAAAQRTQQQS